MEKLWFIHGHAYDLETFLDQHPGGRAILEATRGEEDVTPLFESYHAFANQAYIKEKLETYKVKHACVHQIGPLYTFDEGGFYNTVVARVREQFGSNGKDNISVCKYVKLNRWWTFKVLVQLICLTISSILCFDKSILKWCIYLIGMDSIFMDGFYFTMLSMGAGFIAGIFFIQVGFTVMHDASHFALSTSNGSLNIFASKTWNALSLWKHEFWMYHHTVRHHAYTGDAIRDPDVQHAKPLVRKHPGTARTKYLNVDWIYTFKNTPMSYAIWIVWVSMVYLCLPGMWFGQIIAYWLVWSPKGHLWKMGKHPTKAFKRYWFEVLLNVLVIGIHLYRFDIVVSWSFIFGCNFAYAICILPDHDTKETVLHHTSDTILDWGEVQVRNSANFSNNKWFNIFSTLFGGINYQIEHHLFPSMCHVHYPKISSIVKETCNEFNVPYVSYPSLSAALLDFVSNVEDQMESDQSPMHKCN